MSETKPLLSADAPASFPPAPWSRAVASARDAARFLPQAIGHRGYRAAYPENTMAAFKGAIEVGAHAIETDLHLSSDGVVVLSHDPTLKRCYGVDKKVADCDWAYLSTLKSLKDPNHGMARLQDLLEFLASPSLEERWVLLDVKLDDDIDQLFTAVAKTFTAVPEATKPWNKRIVLGCWNAKCIHAAHRLLPSYPVAHIGSDIKYAEHFFPIPGLNYNMYQLSLMGCRGARFLEKARADNRSVFTWTVDSESLMEWCIRKNWHAEKTGGRLIDGVITDDPKLFKDMCNRWEDEMDGKGTLKRSSKGLVGDILESVAAGAFRLMFPLLSRVFLYRARRAGRLTNFKDVKRLTL